ncbi:MAG: multicopper oxidase domain-containing protein [Thermomicrobiales bacterium]|nr:multicopper oxidase domain-containing protein [Thermomicrobiales bacterium]
MTNKNSLISRRSAAGLLGLMGVSAVGAAVATGAGPNGQTARAAGVSNPMPGHDMMLQPVQYIQAEEVDVEAMDAMHEAGVKAFPAQTRGLGGQPLDFEMDGDVKVFTLTTDVVEWEFMPGKTVEAWTYNGVTPGPEIRVTEGDKVRVHVTNNLPESTAIHWHGLMIPNSQDGVPYLTQPPIKPGETYTYEFQIREGNAGSHMYHSHHNALDQVNRGLLGAFIVDPKDPSAYPAYDKEHILILNDTLLGFTINGKEFPATDAIVAAKGDRLLVRFMNEGLVQHPMHLHGLPMRIVAIDRWPLPQPYMCDTIDVAPGNRYDAIIECTEPGVWAFHCHILSHAESPQGMFGMVTALVIQ